MIIDSKLPGLKSYLSKNRLNNDGVKTSINQSAITPSEQKNLDLELKDSTKNSQESYKKNKKEQSKNPEEQKKEKHKKHVETETEVETKKRNMKLLNLL